MNNLISIISPVINQMGECHIKSQLLTHFPLQKEELAIIENSFIHLNRKKTTKGNLDIEVL